MRTTGLIFCCTLLAACGSSGASENSTASTSVDPERRAIAQQADNPDFSLKEASTDLVFSKLGEGADEEERPLRSRARLASDFGPHLFPDEAFPGRPSQHAVDEMPPRWSELASAADALSLRTTRGPLNQRAATRT